MVRALSSLLSIALATFFAAAGVAEAAYGLRASESTERVRRDLVAQQLLTELTALLGHGASRSRLARFEDLLRPIYSALPKNEAGSVDQGVARYALHRYLLTHHGWYIRGLAPDGERWNASSSTTMLKSKMPTLVLELLEERVGREHIGLSGLAVLVATVEDLVHGDALELLAMAYDTYGLSMDEPLANQEEEDLVLQTFLLYFLSPYTQDSRHNVQRIREYLRRPPYMGWRDTMVWLEDMKQTVMYQDRGVHSPFSGGQAYFRDFASMAHLAEHVIDGIGTFQDIECKMLKHQLMELEDQDRNDGRIPLSKFYRSYMAGGSSVFSESADYLRHLGALDESDPKRPSVVVPNFMYARTNCLATSGFHSLCCIDECNSLMENLERSIAHPVASPGVVAALVAALPSDTVAAPRNLSGSLRRKLDNIAQRHGGHVPLHGRMFAQWMHHAFPNECPNPGTLGTEAPMTAREWQQATRSSTRASQQEMRQVANLAAEGQDADGRQQALSEATMHWSEEEELVTSLDLGRLGVPKAERDGQESVLRRVGRFAAMCGAVASLLSMLAGSFRAAVAVSRLRGWEKGSCSGSLPRWFSEATGAAAAGGKSHFV